MADIGDLNKFNNRVAVSMARSTGVELFLASVAIFRLLAYFYCIIIRDTESVGVLVAIIVTELVFQFTYIVANEKRKLFKASLRVLIGMATAVAFYYGLYVNSLIAAYLRDVQVRPLVVVMQVVMMIFLAFYSVWVFIVSCNGIYYLRSVHFTETIKIPLMSVAVGLMVFLASFFTYFLINDLDTITINGSVYQTVSEGFVKYEGKSKVKKYGNGCMLENSSQNYELLSTPLYISDEERIVMTSVYAIIQPAISSNKRINNLGEIYRQDGSFYVRSDGQNVEVENFFLYDGRNTYIFFENTTMNIGGKNIELSPFSCCEAVYNKHVIVYTPDNQEIRVYPIGKEDVIVTMEDGNLINISMDIINRTDGLEQMLFVQPTLLKELVK